MSLSDEWVDKSRKRLFPSPYLGMSLSDIGRIYGRLDQVSVPITGDVPIGLGICPYKTDYSVSVPITGDVPIGLELSRSMYLDYPMFPSPSLGMSLSDA